MRRQPIQIVGHTQQPLRVHQGVPAGLHNPASCAQLPTSSVMANELRVPLAESLMPQLRAHSLTRRTNAPNRHSYCNGGPRRAGISPEAANRTAHRRLPRRALRRG